MFIETEGLVLRQTKILNGRRMITLFSQKYGKISAGTSISERGKNKTALALRPFSYGKYELAKNGDFYNINGAETIESFYVFGEDVDKYMAAAYVLELTDKILPEGEAQSGIYKLLIDFLYMLKDRKSSYETLVIAYVIKMLAIYGAQINIATCSRCEDLVETGKKYFFSVEDGGLVCDNCRKDADSLSPLIFELSTDIIQILSFIETHPIKHLEKLAIPVSEEVRLKKILSAYLSYHLGIDKLKSEGLYIS